MLLVIIMNYWPNMQPILGNAGVVCQELQRGHLEQAHGGWDQVLHPEHGTWEYGQQGDVRQVPGVGGQC